VQRANKAIVASWKGRPGRVRPRAVDVGLAVAVAVAIAIDVSSYWDPSTRPPDALAYALAATLGVLLLGRRRWPLGVLIVSVVTLQVYHFAGYPGISAAVPLAVALYTAAAAGHLRWSLGIAAVYLAGLLLYAVLWYPGPPGPVLDELVRDGALLAAVLLFGDAVRSHRALMVESYERLRREARELSAARVIQQQLLPRELPSLPGWRMAAYYRPAREVGGDFYDLLELPDGQLVLVTGDATDKGIPAALVMATTHSILRGEAPRLVSPGAVLEQANDRLYPDIPRTCSSPACTRCSTSLPDGCATRTRGTTSLTWRRRTGSRSFTRGGCRSVPCPVCVTRRTRSTSLPARASSSTATASSRRMTQEARCSAFRDSERWSRTAREAIT
jgi:hypothetical protein